MVIKNIRSEAETRTRALTLVGANVVRPHRSFFLLKQEAGPSGEREEGGRRRWEFKGKPWQSHPEELRVDGRGEMGFVRAVTEARHHGRSWTCIVCLWFSAAAFMGASTEAAASD